MLGKGVHLVEIVDGDNILGSLLVVGNTGVLETVTPQDLIGKVGRSHLSNCQSLDPQSELLSCHVW